MPVKFSFKKAITLVELIIAITLVIVVAAGVVSLDKFATYQLHVADQQARLQNELSYVLDHMAKFIGGAEIGGAIGSVNDPPVRIERVPGRGQFLKVRIDKNRNGRVDPYPEDIWIAYQATIRDTPAYRLFFWAPCGNPQSMGCQQIEGHPPLVISEKIHCCCEAGGDCYNFAVYNSTTNYVEIRLGACYDPSGYVGYVCGSRENPAVYMRTRIRMPAVSAN
ncbi:MAG: hypothetical protein NC826_00545 [Candidatus Omnitrophica bacterium]|nr:hypothetical protein [Candidatus Omnitrophota bacterium]